MSYEKTGPRPGVSKRNDLAIFPSHFRERVYLKKKSATWSPAYINETKTPTGFLPHKCPWSRYQKPRTGVLAPTSGFQFDSKSEGWHAERGASKIGRARSQRKRQPIATPRLAERRHVRRPNRSGLGLGREGLMQRALKRRYELRVSYVTSCVMSCV